MERSPKPLANGTKEDIHSNGQHEEPEANNAHNFAVVCRLLYEGAPKVMQNIFNSIHPPISLPKSLRMAATLRTLRRLKSHGALDEETWSLLFPGNNELTKSKNFTSTLLGVLLRHICHLVPPYPNGWHNWPAEDDKSLSADLARLSCYRQQLAASCGSGHAELPPDNFYVQSEAIYGVFRRLQPQLPTEIRNVLEETLDSKAQQHYLQLVVAWQHKEYSVSICEAKLNNQFPQHRDPELMRSGTMGADQVTEGQKDAGHSKQPAKSHTKEGSHFSKEEMSKYEQSILLQYQKKICDTIQSSDVVGRLVQRSILSHEDKNKINLTTKNSERMKITLELLSKKPSKAFDVFCDIIKFKYKTQYDLLVQAKKAPLQHDKPEEVLEFSKALKQQYQAAYSEYSPIPWFKMAHAPFEECYITPYITDHQGRQLTPQSIFDPHAKSASPRRLLITAPSGTGKSTLSHYLVNEWSKAGDSPMHRQFNLVLLLDLRHVTSDLVSSIISQCLPLSYRTSPKEVADLLQNNQRKVLFIFDGMEDLKPSHEVDIMALIHRDLYKDCGIVVTASTSYPNQSLSKYFDTKLTLMGLDRQQPADLVKLYSRLANIPTKSFADLKAKLATEKKTTFSVLARNPLYCLCMSLIAEMQESLEFQTESGLLQTFIQAAQKLHCIQNNISISNNQVPDFVADLIRKLELFAFETLTQHRLTFPTMEVAALDPRMQGELLNILDIYQAGTASRPVRDSYFCNKVIHEFLAASYICNLEPRQRERHVGHLLAEPHMKNVAIFYCGLPKLPPSPNDEEDADRNTDTDARNDLEYRPMSDFYAKVAQSNLRLHQGFVTKNGQHEDKHGSDATLESRISSLQFSLSCVEESEGDAEALDIITRSLPGHLKMKNKDVISAGALRGLARLLASEACPVTELALVLDHYSDYQKHAMLQLASSIHASQSLTALKLQWTRAEVLALFLATVFGENHSIRAIRIWDESIKATTNISGITWSNLRSACINMHSVREFTFVGCQNVAMVTSVIRNSPKTLEELNLSGCALDLVASQELGGKIERSQTLRLLNLTGVQLKRPDFVYIASGVHLTGSLQELILADMEFDKDSIKALGEALIFNNTLRKLHLTGLELSDESTDIIAQALATNQWLEHVLFTGSALSEEAVRVLRSYKRKGLQIIGLTGRRYISPSQRFSHQNSQLRSPVSTSS